MTTTAQTTETTTTRSHNLRESLTMAIGCAGVLLFATLASATDWPQWGGTQGKNMVSAEKGLPESFVPGEKNSARGTVDPATTKNVKWGVKLCDAIYSTPVIAHGKIFLGGRQPGLGLLMCLDEKTGKLWTYLGLDRSISTASVAEGLVYVCDVAGKLHCVDAETGHCYWIHDTASEVWGSTLVADGKVYMPTPKGLFVLAAGKEKKVLSQINVGATINATPVPANGTLYVASKGGWLWAVRQAAPGQ